MSVVTTEITVAKARLGRIAKAVVALAKRAIKLGLTAPVFEVVEGSEGFAAEHRVATGARGERIEVPTGYMVPTVKVRVSTAPVLVAGWEFLGTIEITDGGNMVHARLPEGVEVPAEWATVKGSRCDHCGMNRNRKHLVVVRKVGTTEEKIIGKACAADYIGDKSAAAIASALRGWDLFLIDLEREASEGFPGSSGEPHASTAVLLAAALDDFDVRGYRKAAYAASTRDAAWDDAFRRADGDLARAEALIAYILGTENGGDWMHNVRVAVGSKYTPLRRAGIVASAVLLEKDLLKAEAEAAAPPAPPSNWVGEVKKREVFAGELTKVMSFDSDFGTRYMYKFLDANDNILVWWTSYRGLEVGDKITGRATVKSHGEYNDIKETVLTRWTYETVSETEKEEVAA